MSNEKEPFVLYNYLLYFWKKKYWFLLIPAITICVSFLPSTLLFKGDPYKGTGLVYTGSVDSRDLTTPENIKAKFSGLEYPMVITVPVKEQVKFTIEGNDRVAIEGELNSVLQEFEQLLIENYNSRLSTTQEILMSLEERQEILEETIGYYRNELQNLDQNIEELGNIGEYLIWAEGNLAEVMSESKKVSNNLVFFEKPYILNVSVEETKSYLVESAIVGFILGMFLTVLWLILLKYLFDARRYYSHD
jgi:hypothetical protein